MTWLTTPIGSATFNAMSGGALQFYSNNILPSIQAGSVYWSIFLDYNINDDITDPDAPVVRAFDGFANLPTYPLQSGNNNNEHYLHGAIPATADPFDSFIVRISTTSQTIEYVALELETDIAWMNPVRVATVGGAGQDLIPHSVGNPGHGRIFARFLGDVVGGPNRDIFTPSTGGLYFRLRIRYKNSASGPGPAVHEMFLGKRRLVSRPPNFPWDDEPRGVNKAVMESKNRTRQRYVRASDFADHRISINPTGVDAFGFDDVASLRAIYTDTLALRNPVWFVNGRDLEKTYFCEIDQDEIRQNLQGFAERDSSLDLLELPVFANSNGELHILCDDSHQTIP